MLKEGSDITVAVHGRLINEVLKAAGIAEAGGVSAEVVKINVISPLPYEVIFGSVSKTGRLLAVEEALDEGSVGRRPCEMGLRGMAVKSSRLINLGNGFIPQGNMPELDGQIRFGCRFDCVGTLGGMHR